MNFPWRRRPTPEPKTVRHYRAPRELGTACGLLEVDGHIPKNRLTANLWKTTCVDCKARIHDCTRP